MDNVKASLLKDRVFTALYPITADKLALMEQQRYESELQAEAARLKDEWAGVTKEMIIINAAKTIVSDVSTYTRPATYNEVSSLRKKIQHNVEGYGLSECAKRKLSSFLNTAFRYAGAPTADGYLVYWLAYDFLIEVNKDTDNRTAVTFNFPDLITEHYAYRNVYHIRAK